MTRGLRRALPAIRCTRDGLTKDVTQIRHVTNTVLNFVPQQEAWVIERFGKYHRIQEAGIAWVVPFLEQIAYVQSLKEMAIDVPSQSGITSDNVTLDIDGVLYVKLTDPHKASYGIEDYFFAVTQLAQTTMRSELGKLTLDKVFQERETLNTKIVYAINEAAETWGVLCLRYEIKDITVPTSVQEAMQMQVEAERKKRAHILESEGRQQSSINIAEGQKRAVVLRSEAEKEERINNAMGEAEAVRVQAIARAEAINQISIAIGQNNGDKAAGFAVAEQYVSAFGKLAQTSTTLMLPSNTGDVSSMVAQAMAIYSKVGGPPADTPPTIPVTPAIPVKVVAAPAPAAPAKK